ncbi:DUF4044 domain-containing protein [Lacticaseibacillus mingshuiensis]|uniref:DUF4044 domain-containing protein n=1 Tax=Lacticaseibacillus mingshuiensis TaxID=2799574 RepID=A0ABW4CMC1_9LACO|nr:DUF4044 domain-containing protein [Lacticaseibacillus mingshuiensis]
MAEKTKKKEPRSKFWYVTHIAAWAMLIVTVLSAVIYGVILIMQYKS